MSGQFLSDVLGALVFFIPWNQVGQFSPQLLRLSLQCSHFFQLNINNIDIMIIPEKRYYGKNA
jgi:hypothetical protein